MSAHPTQDRIEAAYPGYFVMSGPFMVQHLFPDVAKAEKQACIRSLKDQLALCKHSKIITQGKGTQTKAWVLRKLPPISIGMNERYRLKTGLAVNAGGASKTRLVTRSQQKIA